MLGVIFNIEAGNYYSKSTFITILIKHEKLVFMLVILYIREYLYVFTKLFTSNRVSEDFQFQVSGSWNNQKCTALTQTGKSIQSKVYRSPVRLIPSNHWLIYLVTPFLWRHILDKMAYDTVCGNNVRTLCTDVSHYINSEIYYFCNFFMIWTMIMMH